VVQAETFGRSTSTAGAVTAVKREPKSIAFAWKEWEFERVGGCGCKAHLRGQGVQHVTWIVRRRGCGDRKSAGSTGGSDGPPYSHQRNKAPDEHPSPGRKPEGDKALFPLRRASAHASPCNHWSGKTGLQLNGGGH